MSSATTSSGGGRANRTGNRLEKFVQASLQDHDYLEFWNHKAQFFENREVIGGKQYAKQVPVGLTIYKTLRKCDFFIINKERFPLGLIVECKWQQVAGSVDEKYPFLIYNIIKTGIPTIVLMDGAGYKKSAMEWLKDQVSPDRALIGVWNMMEFQTKVNDGFLG